MSPYRTEFAPENLPVLPAFPFTDSWPGPVLTPRELEEAYKYATSDVFRWNTNTASLHEAGQSCGKHQEACSVSMRKSLWHSWADLLAGLGRKPEDALDVTEEELRKFKTLSGFTCLCSGDGKCWRHYELAREEGTKFPMLKLRAEV